MLRHLLITPFSKQFHALNPGWWRLYLVVGVFLAAIVLAILDSSRLSELVVGLVIAIPIGLLVLIRPAFGLVALVLAALVVPINVGTGTGTSVNAAHLTVVLLLGIWFFDMFIIQRKLSVVPSRINLPIIIFSIMCLIGFLSGQLPWFPSIQGAPMRAQLGGISLVFMSLGAFLLVANLVKELKWLKWMTWMFLGLGGIYALGRILPYRLEELVRKVYQYGVDASLFWVWIVALSSSMAIFNTELKKPMRVFLGLICIGALYVSLVIRYDWKSGWLPAVVALLAIVWLGIRKLRIFSILGGLLVALLYNSKLASFLTGSEDYSVMTRSDAYTIVLDIAKRNPITGLGFANYYWYTPLYSILGYHVTFNSHNNYVDLIAQTGVLGLLAFLLFIAVLATIGWRLLKIVPAGFPRAYVIAALGGLAGTMVASMLGDWFLPFVYNVGLVGFRSSVFAWLFLGGLIALEQMYPNAPADASLPHPDTPSSKL